MEVIVSTDNKKLKRYLGNTHQKHHFIYLGEREEGVNRSLGDNAFTEIDILSDDDSAKDGFLRAYIDLIGQLSRKNNSIYWWASYTAAKNPYGTKACFDNVFVYHHIIRNIEESPGDSILIINPPPAIVDPIVRYCAGNAIGFRRLAKSLPGVWGRIKDFLGRGMYLVFIVQMWRKIYIARKYLKRRFLEKIDRNQGYYVLRPWFYDRSITEDGNYRDITFTSLPEYLIGKGKPFLVLAGVNGDYRRIVQKIAGVNDYLILPEEIFLKYADPVRAVIDILTHQIHIDGRIDYEGVDVGDLVRSAIAKEFKGGLVDYMHCYYARRLLENVKVDTYIVTYENNAWEKVNIHTLRQNAPETRIIGHQCTPLFEAKVAIMAISDYEKDIIPIPDRINTIGRITKEVLESYGDYPRTELKESCALRIESQTVGEAVSRGSSYKILVALGGISYRAIDLVNFVHGALKDSQKYQIIIRTHPALPLESFKASLDFDIASWQSFSLSSTMSVVEDIQETDIMIHEGSTLALEALRMGVPVIYASLNEVGSFNPILQCEHFNWAVSKEEELSSVIKTIYGLSDDEFYRQQAEVRRYVTDYINEVTEERLGDYIL